MCLMIRLPRFIRRGIWALRIRRRSGSLRWSGAKFTSSTTTKPQGVDLGHYVREINQRPYVYARHIVPFDVQAKELGTGKSRLEVLESLGLRNYDVATQHRVEDGINAVRTILPRCWFDAKRCARGIDALKLYRSDYDDKLQTLRRNPVHDWASHPADAMRYLAMTLDRKVIMTGFNRRIDMPRLGVA